MTLRQRGFTLMELMIVVVIIAVMMAVILPSLRGVAENNRLRGSVRELMSLMKYARSEAVFNARTTEVFLDTEKRQYWLDLRTPDPKTGKYNPKGKRTTMERKRTLENDVWFGNVEAQNNNIIDGGIIAIDFYPDGSASPSLITVKNTKEVNYTLEVLKSTGMIEMNQGDVDAVKEKKGSFEYPMPPNYDSGYEAAS